MFGQDGHADRWLMRRKSQKELLMLTTPGSVRWRDRYEAKLRPDDPMSLWLLLTLLAVWAGICFMAVVLCAAAARCDRDRVDPWWANERQNPFGAPRLRLVAQPGDRRRQS
jgi:hypothetical protein